MIKLKIKFPGIWILAIVFIAFTNNFAFSPPRDIHAQQDEAVFMQKLKSALNYLESVCGKNGIERVVILKEGKTVFEGSESDIPRNVWSCTKSFTSTVLGLLIEEGKCTLDEKVHSYLPEMKEHYPDVTFRHFATMTSGYRAEGDVEAGGHGQSNTPFQPSSEPLFAPGAEFRYWDSAMNIFALALTKVAGKSIKDYFKEKVADPIGMDPEKWDWKDFGEIGGITVNGGAGNKSKGIYISAREMARFGRLFLNNGKWDGEKIISKQWIQSATIPQIETIIPNDTTPYGFNWWTSGTFNGAPKDTFAAKGFNNNRCIVIPEWDLVIVRLGLDGNIGDEEWGAFIKMVGEAYK